MNQHQPGKRLLAIAIGAVLVVSGLAHALWLVASQAAWEGPVSPRKPALFGISGGLTVWSLAWVAGRLKARWGDSAMIAACSLAMFVEIGLITVQYWRGVPSHFNHASPLDRAIESCMLVLILLVTCVIADLSYRTTWKMTGRPGEVLAIQAGMWLLLVSCLLGLTITLVGQANLQSGRPADQWGAAGVLKFPHGMALHAIQLLPLLSWLAYRWRPNAELAIVRGVVAAQVIALAFALWQTFNGRARGDVELIGGLLLVTAFLCVSWPLLQAWRQRP